MNRLKTFYALLKTKGLSPAYRSSIVIVYLTYFLIKYLSSFCGLMLHLCTTLIFLYFPSKIIVDIRWMSNKEIVHRTNLTRHMVHNHLG